MFLEGLSIAALLVGRHPSGVELHLRYHRSKGIGFVWPRTGNELCVYV